MKKVIATAIIAASLSGPMAMAGGLGGTELAISSYGDLGVMGSVGVPLNIEFLADSGLNTYGELEAGLGFGNDVRLGVEASAGLIFVIDQGLSVYASLGPALSFDNDTNFGLGAEVGVNFKANDSLFFVEVGSHPGTGYFSVGLNF